MTSFANRLHSLQHRFLYRGSGWPKVQPKRSQPCRNGPIERSQHRITRTGRESETTESFGRSRARNSTGAGDESVARRGETETLRHARPARLSQVPARTGDRTRKGRHPKMTAFRITRRSASFATVLCCRSPKAKQVAGAEPSSEIKQRHFSLPNRDRGPKCAVSVR